MEFNSKDIGQIIPTGQKIALQFIDCYQVERERWLQAKNRESDTNGVPIVASSSWDRQFLTDPIGSLIMPKSLK